MTALYIIIGVIAFFIILLSIRITINGEYFDDFKLAVSWLFIKIHIFPLKKKEKKSEEEKPKEQKDEVKEEKPQKTSTKEDNIFVKFYKNQGVDGVVQLVNNAATDIGKFSKTFKKHIVLRELYLWMTVSCDQDAGETALEYGRMCQKVFPPLGLICSTLPVKKYDVDISPDFLGKKNKANFAFSVSVRPIFFINATISLVFRLLFNVVIKFLKGIKNKTNEKEKIEKGGAL